MSSNAVTEKFTEIFETNHWKSDQSASGTGSSEGATRELIPQLLSLIERRGFQTMVDAPCGDFNWQAPVAQAIDYQGFDVVPGVVAAAQARSSLPFAVADITSQTLPTADVIHCRDCLVHLTYDLCWDAIERFKASGSTWLLTTTFPDLEGNHKGRLGGWRALNLQLAPFEFPVPAELIVEKPDREPHPRYGRKCMGLWLIADLPKRPSGI